MRDQRINQGMLESWLELKMSKVVDSATSAVGSFINYGKVLNLYFRMEFMRCLGSYAVFHPKLSLSVRLSIPVWEVVIGMLPDMEVCGATHCRDLPFL
jgi:hypothetical protein